MFDSKYQKNSLQTTGQVDERSSASLHQPLYHRALHVLRSQASELKKVLWEYWA